MKIFSKVAVAGLALASSISFLSAYYGQDNSSTSGYNSAQPDANSGYGTNRSSDNLNSSNPMQRNSTQPYYNENSSQGQYNYEQRNDIRPDNQQNYNQQDSMPRTNNANANSDLEYRIRRVLQNDSSLSPGARDAQIAVDASGNVILRGTVENEAEKKKVEMIAKNASGVKSVTNKLSISNRLTLSNY